MEKYQIEKDITDDETDDESVIAKNNLEYFRNIRQQPPTFKPKTGFKLLDDKLGGGLYSGLYVIGAVCGLGKTSFCLQLADQIALNGNDVMFFSLEMQKRKLIAKSLSRHTFINNEFKKSGTRYLAKNAREIADSKEYSYFSNDENLAVQKAINDYSLYSERIKIYERKTNGQKIDVDIIKELIRSHISTTNRKPIVFIDYLQKIFIAENKINDKQKVDLNISALKEISDDYEIPIICISSFNRSNYEEPVSLSAFKESGSVEFDADFVIGLQYDGVDYLESDSTEYKRKLRVKKMLQKINSNDDISEYVRIQFKMLKNREYRSFDLLFDMLPEFNYFMEVNKKELKKDENEDDGLIYRAKKKNQ